MFDKTTLFQCFVPDTSVHSNFFSLIQYDDEIACMCAHDGAVVKQHSCFVKSICRVVGKNIKRVSWSPLELS